MVNLKPSPPASALFKGIALFTPGGDVVYCLDPHKQQHWHAHLCGVLQQALGLLELPHFLMPCYTATVDRWFDAQSQQVQTIAEAAAPVLRYQGLLNAIFGTHSLVWQRMPIRQDVCDPAVLATYRQQFPQLWEHHDLILQYTLPTPTKVAIAANPLSSQLSDSSGNAHQPAIVRGYVLHLFVSGSSGSTENTLKRLHRLLEESLGQPYTLKVIDVSQHPDLAEQHHVTATPTLVRVYPQPIRRIVGNLDSVDQLLGFAVSSEDWV
jgi:circadian clock protein KaiB